MTGFSYTTNEITVPNEYRYQLIKLKNTKKGKKPELTMGAKWEIKKVNGESAQVTGFLHATNETTVPNDYLYQLIKLKNTMKR